MSGYDLKHFTTAMGSAYANGNSDIILARYPFLVSREALYAAILSSGVQSDSQRNPNSYSVTQIVDKIIAHFDALIVDYWEAPEGQRFETPLAFDEVQSNYNWSQREFWTNSKTSYIAVTYDPNINGTQTAAQIAAKTDLIILPSFTYDINTTQYKQKPFLSWDFREQQIINSAGTSFTPAGTGTFGLELDVNGSKQVTGLTTSSPTQVDPNSDWSSTKFHNSLLHVYDYNFYHPNLNVNGTDFSVHASYTGHDNLATSTKWFDLRAAQFSVSTSGGAVTAITPVARNDGDGVSRTGGWGYVQTDNDYQELFFVDKITQAASNIKARVLFRANTTSDVSNADNKATVDISDVNSEFYGGVGQSSTYVDTAYAVFGLGDRGYAAKPTVSSADATDHNFRQWPSATLHNGIDPAVVRVESERPVLTSTTRSLKTTVTGTGAQRYTFEFEYPPMNRAEAEAYFQAFDEYKGAALPIQLWIPYTAIQHVGYWTSANNKSSWSNYLTVDSTSDFVGSDTVVLLGHKPGDSPIDTGIFFTFVGTTKLYQIVRRGTETADDYGRVAYNIEPPIVETGGAYVVSNPTGSDTDEKNYLRVKAELVDETLDYSVDAAGIYRMSFKFREAL